jgi:hypothetical protein
MVRVGGGWTALDEFLVRHDPCRGKIKNLMSGMEERTSDLQE